MKIILLSTIVLLAAAQVGLAQRRDYHDRSRYASASSHTGDGSDFDKDYDIFADLNIFLRSRHPRVQPTESRPPRTPEQTFVLTGIVQDDNGTYHANFENLNGGSLVKVNVGNPLARGKISDIQPDQVSYEANGGKTWVQIGNNLTGSDGGMPTVPSSDSGGPAVDPNAPGLSVEQRMRARRMQQMNGGGSPPSNSTPQPTTPAAAAPTSSPPIVTPPQDVYNGPPQIIIAAPGPVGGNDPGPGFPPGGPPPSPPAGEGQ